MGESWVRASLETKGEYDTEGPVVILNPASHSYVLTSFRSDRLVVCVEWWEARGAGFEYRVQTM